ncbi:MAG: proline--tRNA ligase, partial [Calothrix sp. SM1_5_4]|nr:proline--tRNA ligase [Calothrix sp. SM1_5_4]
FVQQIGSLLGEIQDALFQRALEFRDRNVREINSLDEFKKFFAGEEGGGFAAVPWNPAAIGHPVLAELKVSPRCIPLDGRKEAGTCIFSGQPSSQRVIFARAY